MKWTTGRTVRHETLGAVTASSRGTQVDSGSAGTKGSWTNVGSTTTFTYESLTVCFKQANNSNEWLLDVGISVSGNRFVIMPDLRCAGDKQNHANAFEVCLPIHVPAGSQLSCRAQSEPGGSAGSYVVLIGHSAGMGGMPGYSRGLALYTESGSMGAVITPTSADTKTSYVELTTGISQPVDCLLFHVGAGGEYTRSAACEYLVDLAIGAAASEQIVLANMQFSTDITSDTPSPQYFGPLANHIPASTRVAARAQSSDVTVGERAIDVAAWGFVQ